MNMQFFDFDPLEKELQELPPLHRVAFATSCCERMLPNYNTFCTMVDWGNPQVPLAALDEVWQILQGKPVDAVKICQLRENCGNDEVFPDDLDFGGTCYETQEYRNIR